MDREIVKEESMYDFYKEQTLLLTDENKKLKKEIKILNNIINELKEYCGNTTILHAGKILNIIEGSNKNE